MKTSIQATANGNGKLSIEYNPNSHILTLGARVQTGKATIELDRNEAIESVIDILNRVGVTQQELDKIAEKLT